MIGGHDIRQTSFAESAEEFRRNSGVFEADWIARVPRRAGGGHRAGPARHALRRGQRDRQARALGRREAAANGRPGRRPHRRRHGRVRRGRIARPHDRPERRQHRAPFRSGRDPPALGRLERRARRRRARAASRQLALRAGRVAVRLHLYQLHAQPGRLAARPRRAGPIDGLALRRQGRQDRRDLDEDGPRPDVRRTAISRS